MDDEEDGGEEEDDDDVDDDDGEMPSGVHFVVEQGVDEEDEAPDMAIEVCM